MDVGRRGAAGVGRLLLVCGSLAHAEYGRTRQFTVAVTGHRPLARVLISFKFGVLNFEIQPTWKLDWFSFKYSESNEKASDMKIRFEVPNKLEITFARGTVRTHGFCLFALRNQGVL